MFLILNCPTKKVKFSEDDSSHLTFQETIAHERQACTDLSEKLFSSAIIVAPKDLKDIEYLVSW